jgi:predicted porin
MKKSLIALASVAALGAAHADVTLYGVIDASFASVSAGGSSDGNNPGNMNTLNSYASPGAGSASQITTAIPMYNGRTTSMANGVLEGSRWGIKGEENLGGGLKANFVLESALNIAAGTNPNDHALLASGGASMTGAGDSAANGQMFDRQSTVGLTGDFGSIDVGFQANSNIDANASIDPFKLGGISPVGFYSSWNGGGSSYTRMASNSIKYKYSMGMTQVEGFYAMGGASGNAGAGSQVGLMAKVQASPTLSITIAASRMNDDVSFDTGPISGYSAATLATSGSAMTYAGNAQSAGANGSLPGLTATYYNSTTSILGGTWKASNNLELKGGYISISMSNPSNPLYDSQIAQNNGIPINPQNVLVNAYGNGNFTRNIGFIGGTYDLTPQSHLTAAFYQETLNAYTKTAYGAGYTYPAAGGGVAQSLQYTQAYAANTAQIFSVAYKYDLSKRTDVYAAASYESWNAPGAIKPATITASNATPINQTTSAGTSQSLFAVGLRTRF